MSKPLRLRAFGGLVLERDSGGFTGAANQRRRLAMLATLAVSGSRGVSRAKMLALFWPETDEPRGRQALSQALYALRKDTGEEQLVLGSDTLQLNAAVITSDVGEFEDAIAKADIERAAALYTAPFLDGVYLSEAAGFERWSEDQRVRYAHLAERVIEELATDANKRGDYKAAANWWRRLTTLDPLKTRGAVGLMNALAASGDRSDALRHADAYSKLVRGELGAEPSHAVRALANRLREIRGDDKLGLDAADSHTRIGGRFEIEREIGRGGMAVVFLAHDRKHNRRVALKMLHSEVSSAVGRERLQREIMVTARLQHPHILPLYDSGESDGALFYVMPFVEGESLRARLAREERLPVDDALCIAREVADALDHAHRHGVIHRDIKPENILLAEGHAIVADFGIARTLSEALGATLTQNGVALGTPAYMSPEQIAGDSVTDARSDVYSLGCVLYEMLSGRPPWIGTDVRALMARRFTEQPEPLHVLVSDIPPDVDELVARMLASEPEKRYENGGGVGQAIAALMNALRRPSAPAAKLPTFTSPLIGRGQELKAARALLSAAGVRLLTFTGVGGSGKTRLAIQLATDVAPLFQDGVFFVDLSAVSDATHVLPTIGQALGIKDEEGKPAFDTVCEFLGDRRALLVLDNIEQVAASTPELARLLRTCERLSLLVTSRVLLRVRGEHEFHVPPLGIPDLSQSAGDLRNAAAVQLFVERALEARPELTFDDEALRTIAQICVRIDGLPLAIELAAARSKLLSPRGIQSRLEKRLDLLAGGPLDQPKRHQTLRAAIGWSYELLREDARRAFRRFAVFAGGCELDAIISVISADDMRVLELVEALVNASLIRRNDDDAGEGRFTMLETIREFALEQLRDAGDEDAARNAHRDFYRALAERVTLDLTGEDQSAALTRLNSERDNLRSVLDWTERSSQADLQARLTLSLWRYWLVRGQWNEGRDWLRRALANPDVGGATRAELFVAAGSLAQNQGDYITAVESFERAIDIWREIKDAAGVARTLASMGWLRWRQCRFADARRLSTESLELHRSLRDDRGVAQSLNNLGWVAIFEGNYGEAETVLAECLAIRRRLRDRRNIAFVLTSLAWASTRMEKIDAAHAMLDESIAIFRDLGEKQLYAFALRVRSELRLRDDAGGAVDLLQRESVPIFRSIGDRWGLEVALGVLGDALLALGRIDEAESAFSESLDLSRALDDPYGLAMAQSRLGITAARRSKFGSAADSLVAADRLLAEINGVMAPYQREIHDRTMTMVQKFLGSTV